MKRNTLAVLMLSLTLSSCSLLDSLKPGTITHAAIAHATFPTLAMQVQDCVADHPEVRAEIVAPFNRLVDIWQQASRLKPDATLLTELVNAPAQITDAKVAWVTIRRRIGAAQINCGPAVLDQVARIEQTFTEMETAILINRRAVYVLQWMDLLSSVVLGRRGEVVKMT